MSDRNNPTKLDEQTMEMMQRLTISYLRALDVVAGRQMKVAMVLAPTTLETEDTDGTTQVQILGNMEPQMIQRVFRDMSQAPEIVFAARTEESRSPAAFVMPGNGTAN